MDAIKMETETVSMTYAPVIYDHAPPLPTGKGGE